MDKNSPLSFNTLEFRTAVLIAIFGVIGFFFRMQDPGYFISVSICWPTKLCCEDGLNCDIPERTQIFIAFIIPLGCILAIGGISFVRAIQERGFGFSSLGHWSMAWPLLSSSALFIGGPWLTLFCLWPLPFIGLIMAIVASIKSFKKRQYYRDWYAILINLVVLIVECLFVIVWNKYSIFS